jgi:phosphoglycolate phosphatase
LDLTQRGDLAAILFDKDGTLFDFGATWNGFAVAVIQELADGDLGLAAALAEAARFDMGESRFHPDSPMIAGTNREAAELLAAVLPGSPVDAVEIRLTELAATARVVEAVPLGPFLDGLSARGLALGVMTNDSETAARAHLAAAGVHEAFDFIAGFDSGHGAKPAPEPLLAFCAAVGRRSAPGGDGGRQHP